MLLCYKETVELEVSEPQEEQESSQPAQSNSTPAQDSSDSQDQTLYVAIQPGADSSQVDHPAVYVEVVEAGNGTEIPAHEEQVVQDGVVIDQSKLNDFFKKNVVVLPNVSTLLI